jgi:hypothetical protein
MLFLKDSLWIQRGTTLIPNQTKTWGCEISVYLPRRSTEKSSTKHHQTEFSGALKGLYTMKRVRFIPGTQQPFNTQKLINVTGHTNIMREKHRMIQEKSI